MGMSRGSTLPRARHPSLGDLSAPVHLPQVPPKIHIAPRPYLQPPTSSNGVWDTYTKQCGYNIISLCFNNSYFLKVLSGSVCD